MSFVGQRNIFRNAAARLSAAHPLIYLVLYIVAVPIFAFSYSLLPGGFYAPYARLEQSGRSDAYEIGLMFQSAIRRSIQRAAINQSDKWIYRPDTTYVQRLKATETGMITFDLLVMAYRRENEREGAFQFPVTMSLQHSASLLIVTSNEGQSFFRVFNITVSIVLKELFDDPRLEGLYEQIIRDFTRIELSPDEDQTLGRFFSGIEGDPLSITGSMKRMLYFSAIVITTVGFGDIIPMTYVARILVACEALLGVTLAGLFINSIAYRSARRL